MLEPKQPTAAQALQEEWFDTWQATEPLATAGGVALWRATDGNDGSALLRLYPRFRSERTWRRFTAAAAQRAMLDHPRLLPLAKLGTHGRPHLLLSDPVGEPLATRIEREPLRPEIALQVFDDVATALAALARAGVGPVEITTADVFLVAGDRGLLLADAGLLRQVEHERDGVSRPSAASMGRAFAAVLQAALVGPAESSPYVTPAIDRLLTLALADNPRRGYRTPGQIVDSFGDALAAAGGRRRWIASAAVVPCVAVAAVLGALAGAMTTPADSPSLAPLAAGGLSVEAPAEWSRVPAAEAPFETGADALVARPAADPSVGLAVTRSGDSLLASARGTVPTAVALRAGDVWRYPSVRIGERVANVYLLQTVAGPVIAACYGPVAAGPAPLARCGAIVDSLRVRGTEALPLGGEPAVREKVTKALAALESDRVAARRELASASRRQGQVAAANTLTDAYAEATRAAAGPETVGFPGARTRLVAELAAGSRSYSELATAAASGDAAAYAAARRAIAKDERELGEAIAALAPTAKAD